MASEDVKPSESAVSTIVNLAEEAKMAREGVVKAPSLAVLSVCKSLVAGGVAGGVSRTAVAPLERLKILLQVQNPHNIKYNGTIQGLKYIWRSEGFRGLFKGNGTNCARIVPNSAVKFFSYEQASKRCSAHSSSTSWSWSMCWNYCHVCNLPDGHGTRKANCTDRELSLSVQGNVPCSIDCAPRGGPAGFVQGMASFCNWSFGLEVSSYGQLMSPVCILYFFYLFMFRHATVEICGPYIVDFCFRFPMLVSTLLCMNP
ncbi:PREDICTED: mitochondrial [Prunus dulcis]|uniref:PREDICTED: mitochondrial n=1 Tax=Prunus dulcis TaxID=3755 RepID=A0A5E4F6L9_PRUDU|nr:PREDICTED: mitochondrial [Prunus dulcis]